jgi:hypothetical protein
VVRRDSSLVSRTTNGCVRSRVEMQLGVIRYSEAEKRRRLGIALAAAVALALGLSRPQMAGAAAKGGDAMTNWASDVITETASASGRDPVEANRVTLTVAGGPVVVQWSLSYDAYVRTFPGLGPKRVRWSHPILRLARTRRRRDRALEARRPNPGPLASVRAAWVAGSARGLFVDRASASGPRTYVLKVWNLGPRINVSTRTMICEER